MIMMTMTNQVLFKFNYYRRKVENMAKINDKISESENKELNGLEDAIAGIFSTPQEAKTNNEKDNQDPHFEIRFKEIHNKTKSVSDYEMW